jgi:hypothetical protein
VDEIGDRFLGGATCVLHTANLHHTEAFAGRGEFAVVRLVIDILGAKATSLILLDEPEVSLHLGPFRFILSKAFMLAADDRIADPTILRQIKPAHSSSRS